MATRYVLNRDVGNEKIKLKAEKLVARRSNIGASKLEDSESIRSLGTLRNYSQVIKQYLQWLELNNFLFSRQDSVEYIKLYLNQQAERYQQKTLCQHRMALNKAFNKKVPFIKAKIATALETRTYGFNQIIKIIGVITPKFKLAVLLCYFCGLRASELGTIRRLKEDSPSEKRQWREDIFSHDSDFSLYIVTGKGGLKRLISIPNDYAKSLECLRLAQPITKNDRGIYYQSFYDLPFGQSLSQTFSAASKKALGFSHGLHGCRHNFAQNTLLTLLRKGVDFEIAKTIVSQKLGHFRPSITNTYFR